ncbi:Oidioi.mRNA.OKI2018_I69.chr2.g6903.t1.cds [Oikopleura dioica]|uniref:Oidioi.mRNA.OKI2018_I69.chr2.g6903.t1.cds n=1 Tax=Oikopleura dioica TaxID=34765 RepID=A0ABN7T9A9_OIKDI|nr:Oidioi.mRNA.OKI2018_I69.chr2.g6903.t1.cds [Oikopleura dioica]
MLLQETRMEKIIDEKYDDFTEKFREIDEKIATLQNSSEQNSQNDQNFQIQSQLLKILNRLEIVESSKLITEERMKRMEENFQKEKADLLEMVEKAEEKSRRAARSVEKVQQELEQLKQSIEKEGHSWQ